jgi:hypothetical protein
MPKKRPKVIRGKKGSEPSAAVSIDPNEARFLLLEGRLLKVEALLDIDPADVFLNRKVFGTAAMKSMVRQLLDQKFKN